MPLLEAAQTAEQPYNRNVLLVEALLEASSRRRRPALHVFADATIPLVALRVLVSLGAWLSGHPIAPAEAPLGSLTSAALFVCYGTAGVLLLTVGRRDERARYLGAFFLVIASAFAREPAEALAMTSGPGVLRELVTQRYDPLLPLYLSLFVSGFPRHATASLCRPCNVLITACGWFAALAGMIALADLVAPGWWLLARAWLTPGDAYWTTIFGLVCGALILLLWRSRSATGAERVRSVWFSAGLALGLAPVCVAVLLYAASETFKALTLRPDVRSALGAVIALGLLTIPPSTLYAVAVRQVIEIRIVIRRALRCALAKVAVLVLCLSPPFLLAWTAYVSRNHTIAEFAQDPGIRSLILATAIGIISLAAVPRLLGWVERVILHGPYDSFAAIRDLRQRLETAANPAAVIEHTRRVIEATLRPANVRAVYAAYRGGPFMNTTTGLRALAADSTLVEALTRAGDTAVPVTDALLRFVSTSDAAWLSASCAEHLLCVRSAGAEVIGIIALAERSNERPYTIEDYRFLSELAQTAAVPLQHLARRRPVERYEPQTESSTLPATECSGCGQVCGPEISGTCPSCGHPLDICQLPPVVSGKFRIQKRLGRGGMGVVYQAIDERLQRRVAVKTLPYISLAAEHRLEREAQLMARVSHPHIAAIYSLEAWGDRPVLVTEYLPGGTVQTRLLTGRPEPRVVVSWGLQLADGLTGLHREGLIHGDLKPSNVGFDVSGAAKLLDFGLADTAAGRAPNAYGVLSIPNHTQFGTPFYACPDMDQRQRSPSSDLWSLALLLYEALAGRAHIHSTATGRPKLPLTPLADLRPDVPTTLSHFFVRALSPDPALRPSSAAEFGLWLRRSAPIAAVATGTPYSSL